MPKTNTPKQLPTELAWLRAQGSQISHLNFFNHFTSYSHRRALSRFQIVISALENEELKKTAIDAFNDWKKSRAAKDYWIARENASQVENDATLSSSQTQSIASRSQSNSSRSSSSSGASSLKSVETISLTEAKKIISNYINTDETESLDGQDIPTCMTRFKHSVFSSLDTSLLTMETHLQHILSLSNIFMLGKHRSHPDLSNFFKTSVKQIREELYKDVNYNITQTKFPKEKREAITDIVNQLAVGTIKKSAAVNMISTYIDDNTDNITEKLIMCIKAFVESLPHDAQSKPIQELELSTRYLQRFFQSLFDEEYNSEGHNNYVFKWTNTITFNNNTGDEFTTRDRPDGCIENDAKTIGYIEVKTIENARNHFKINLDLHRLAVYARTAMKKYQLKHVFQIMAIGSNVQFFISQKHGEDTISTVELDCIRLPMSLNELPSLIPYMDRLYNVVEVIQNKCFSESNVDSSCQTFSPSLEPRVLKAIIERRVDRARDNCFFHPYL